LTAQGLSPCQTLSLVGCSLYAFDLIEHDGEDLGNRRFLDRKEALAAPLRDAKAGILLNEHIAEDGATVFAHACRLGAEGTVSKRVDGTYRSGLLPDLGLNDAVVRGSV
jgi:ATP-dependent DNA ligase